MYSKKVNSQECYEDLNFKMGFTQWNKSVPIWLSIRQYVIHFWWHKIGVDSRVFNFYRFTQLRNEISLLAIYAVKDYVKSNMGPHGSISPKLSENWIYAFDRPKGCLILKMLTCEGKFSLFYVHEEVPVKQEASKKPAGWGFSWIHR